MKVFYLIISLVFVLSSCKQKEEQTDVTQDEPAATKYTLTPFSSSHDYPDATLRSIDYKDGKFIAEINSTSYKLGEQTPDADQKQCANSAEGQHIHLIIDNEPYIAKYTSTFQQTIPDGDHYVLAFLSRSYHESLKSDQAHKLVKATVKDTSFQQIETVSDPMLFYSRPKGLYTGKDKEKVMLDFYLVNTDLTNRRVEAEINGEKHMIDQWQPYYIEGLPDGENTIKLTLVDTNGNVVNTPLNPVTRTFQLEKAPETN